MTDTDEDTHLDHRRLSREAKIGSRIPDVMRNTTSWVYVCVNRRLRRR